MLSGDPGFTDVSQKEFPVSVVTVNSAASLVAALKVAQPGDTILLETGYYTNFNIDKLSFTTPVTITSKDPNAPAVIGKMGVLYSKGITFTNLEFSTAGITDVNAVRVSASENITFSKVNVHGSLDGNPNNDLGAIAIRDSRGVKILDSEFHELKTAITHMNSTGLLFEGNYIHNIGADGIIGSGSSQVTIKGNYFTDFFPLVGYHPDAIQFHTANVTTSPQDIWIEGNVITRGSGLQVQGIFLGNETANLPYVNVTIKDNFLAGTLWHGIAVNAGTNILVEGNTVLSFADQVTRISVGEGTILRENAAYEFIYGTLKGQVPGVSNTLVGFVNDGGAAALKTWLGANPLLASEVPTDLLLKLGYTIATVETAPPVAPEPEPEPVLTPVAEPTPAPEPVVETKPVKWTLPPGKTKEAAPRGGSKDDGDGAAIKSALSKTLSLEAAAPAADTTEAWQFFLKEKAQTVHAERASLPQRSDAFALHADDFGLDLQTFRFASDDWLV